MSFVLPLLAELATCSAAWSQTTNKTEVTPIDLETVLKLTERQNPPIIQAQAKVREADIQSDNSCRKCLSDMACSPSFYRRMEVEGKVGLQQSPDRAHGRNHRP